MPNPITPLTPEQEAQQEAATVREGYVRKDLIAVDQAANVFLGGLPDETISSRMARWAGRTGVCGFVGRTVSRGLDLFSRDHGAKAEAGDVARAKAVIVVEETSGNLPRK